LGANSRSSWGYMSKGEPVNVVSDSAHHSHSVILGKPVPYWFSGYWNFYSFLDIAIYLVLRDEQEDP